MDNHIKEHWEKIYQTKQPNEVSWTQEIPTTSLQLIHSFNLPKTAKIIDVGGGDSKLVDFLLAEGFEYITVLDISGHAIQRAKDRLGPHALKVKWIISDITEFKPECTYDLWHDRATFHFLTTPEKVKRYLNIAKSAVNSYLVIGTFSTHGPQQCSGLQIRQYDEQLLTEALQPEFTKVQCLAEDHRTPFNTIQNFLYCSFICRPAYPNKL